MHKSRNLKLVALIVSTRGVDPREVEAMTRDALTMFEDEARSPITRLLLALARDCGMRGSRALNAAEGFAECGWAGLADEQFVIASANFRACFALLLEISYA